MGVMEGFAFMFCIVLLNFDVGDIYICVLLLQSM